MHFALNTEQARVQKTSVFRFIPLSTKAPPDKLCAARIPFQPLTLWSRTCLQNQRVVYLISFPHFVLPDGSLSYSEQPASFSYVIQIIPVNVLAFYIYKSHFNIIIP